MDKEDIRNLQILEQSMQSIYLQKQQFQAQILETESALKELEKTDSAYKIVGTIMIASDKSALKKDLESKKEIFSARLKVLSEQEEKFKKEATDIQKKMLKEKK